jgi:hypothetical protein
MSETLSVFFDGEVFKPDAPLNLKPNTRYQITLESEFQSGNSLNDLNFISQHYQLKDEKKVLEFLSQNNSLVEFLIKAEQTIKQYFPDAELDLSLEPFDEPDDEAKLILTISAQGESAEVRSQFNKLKSEWWFKSAGNLLDKISLAIEHPEFSTNKSLEGLGNLIGSVEAPEDWAAEHDFYLYGTPKRNQSSPDNG